MYVQIDFARHLDRWQLLHHPWVRHHLRGHHLVHDQILVVHVHVPDHVAVQAPAEAPTSACFSVGHASLHSIPGIHVLVLVPHQTIGRAALTRQRLDQFVQVQGG